MEDIVDLFPKEHKTSSKKTLIILTSLVVLIGVCVMAIVFFGLGPMLAKPVSPLPSSAPDVSEVLGMNDIPEKTSGTQLVAKDQLEQLLKSIAQQVDLPPENSVLAYQIIDLTNFKQSEFFDKAEVGDVYITFEPSKKVLLYSRLQGKVINSGEISKQ